MTASRVTRGFVVGDEAEEAPRRVRTRAQIAAGEGRRPPESVELSALAHNPFNPRSELTEIEETAASLSERGQLQPVAVVRRAAFLAVHGDQAEQIGDAEYVVIDGNRRLASAHVAGVAKLRIDVNDSLASSAADILEAALMANVHRVDVAPLDQAQALQELVGVHGSQATVAKRLGKSPGWVSQRLALLELAPDLQEKVAEGALPVRDGRRIGKLDAEAQRKEGEAAIARAQAPRRKAAPKPAPLESNAPESGPKVADPSVPAPAPEEGHTAAQVTQDVVVEPAAAIPGQGSVPDEGAQLWQDPQAVFDVLRDRMTTKDIAALIMLMIQYKTDRKAQNV
ncbi:ParB/RepB/Spo0J family partition protein [Streptomyces sp. NPDC054952]